MIEADQFELQPDNYLPTWKTDKADSLVILKKYNFIRLVNKNGGKVFPNFIIYQQMFPKGSFYKSAILAMKYQQTNSQVIVDEFCKLAVWLGKASDKQIEDFKLNYKNDILGQYAKQSFFHKLLNNLLRQADDLTEIFYVQPFVKQLSQSIKQKYQKYSQQQKLLVCYRGGYLTESEQQQFINNTGGFVQYLGFMSTSTNIQIAYNFATNTVIVIYVNAEERHEKYDYGYAFMENQVQQEVLFNVLASFIILGTSYIKHGVIEYLKIELQYGKAAALHAKYHKDQNLIPKQDKKIIPILISQHIGTPTNQKSAIFEDIRKVKHCQIYLEIAYEVINKIPDSYINNFVRLETLAHLTSFYYINHQLQKARILYQIVKAQPRQIPELTDKALFKKYNQYSKECYRCHPIGEYLLRTILIAGYHYYTGNFVKAAEIIDDADHYFRCIQRVRRHEVKYLWNLSNIYHTYFSMFCAIKVFTLYLTGRKEQILKFTTESKMIAKEQYGKSQIFISKIQEVQMRIFGRTQSKAQKDDLFQQLSLQIFDKEDYFDDLFQKGGLIGFIGTESTRVFYQLLEIQEKADALTVCIQTCQYEKGYKIGYQVLQKFHHAPNRLQYFFSILRIVPLLLHCIDQPQAKQQFLTNHRQEIKKQPQEQWSSYIKQQIQLAFQQAQKSIQEQIANNPSQIVTNLFALLQQILQKFPILSQKNTLNLQLYKIILNSIKEGQYRSSWKMLQNGIYDTNLLYPNSSIDYRIKKVVHSYHLHIGAAILELSGQKQYALRFYDKIKEIVEGC